MIDSIVFLNKNFDEKHQYIYGYLALLLESLTPIFALLMQKNLINQVFIGKDYDSFIYLIVLYACFFFAPKLFFTIRKVIFFKISYHIQARLSKEFLCKVYDLPNEIADEQHSGKLLHHLRSDISEVCYLGINIMMSEVVKIILSIILLVLTIAIMNTALLFPVLVISLIYYTLLLLFGDKTKRLSKAVKENKANVSVKVEESVSGLKEVVSYNRQAWQLNKYIEDYNSYYKLVLKKTNFRIKTFLVSDPLLHISKLLVILIGAFAIMDGKGNIGEFIVSFTLVDLLITELGLLFDQSMVLKRFDACKDILEEIFQKRSESYGNLQLDCIRSIEFNQVSFSYDNDKRIILDDISLSIPLGKKIALVGHSGCGKSTIAKLLTRSIKCKRGDLLINGIPIDSYDNQFGQHISIVQQSPHLLPYSLYDNLRLHHDYSEETIRKVTHAMQCKAFIEELADGYNTLVGENGTSLSGGQRQRIAISRAILRDSDILILDEATSALDTATESLVQKNIDELRKDKTTIIIAHRLSTIQNADLIYVMENGKILDQGSHEELLKTSSTYKKLSMSQTE